MLHFGREVWYWKIYFDKLCRFGLLNNLHFRFFLFHFGGFCCFGFLRFLWIFFLRNTNFSREKQDRRMNVKMLTFTGEIRLSNFWSWSIDDKISMGSVLKKRSSLSKFSASDSLSDNVYLAGFMLKYRPGNGQV